MGHRFVMIGFHCCLCLVLGALVLTVCQTARADIYRWDNGQLIPGTEGIEPGPKVLLNFRELEFAALQEIDLTESQFASSNLTSAHLYRSNLTGAYLYGSTLAQADLSGAVVTGANFFSTTSLGFTLAQLKSTVSFQAKNLTGINLGANDLGGWDFRGQDLTNARLNNSTLTDADLSGTIVKGASFVGTTSRGFARGQLESTASYQTKDLQGIQLLDNDLTGWDFHGQNLASANLSRSTLTNANLSGTNLTNAYLAFSTLTDADLSGANLNRANLTGAILASARLNSADLSGADFSRSVLIDANLENAVVTDANFRSAVANRGGGGFTMVQLYSTESYQTRDLQGIGLSENNLRGWDFSRQDLSRADFSASTLTDADFVDAIITGANLSQATARGFTKEQLYSTHSYKNLNLRGVRIGGWISDSSLTPPIVVHLNDWDFRSQDLTNAVLEKSSLTGADFSDALVQGTNLNASDLTKEQLYSTASYQAKDLRGIGLLQNNLSGWDFSEQILVEAWLASSVLANSNLTGASLVNANLERAWLTGADFSDALVQGTNLNASNLTKEQLYSTASYQAKDLRGIGLLQNNLSGWDFSEQTLTSAYLKEAMLTNSNLKGASLVNANLEFARLTGANFMGADLRGAYRWNSLNDGTITKNTILPDGRLESLSLSAGEYLLIRDDDGVQNPPTPWWLPPREPIAVTVQQNVMIVEGATLRVLFESDAWDSLISFEPGIPVQLGGTLELTFTDDVDVAAQIGRTLHIFDWTGVEPTGAFTVSSRYPWDTSELYSTGEVTLLLPGDTNADGAVNINDLNNVRNNFGLAGEGISGDTNADQVIDLVDLTNVRNFFGFTPNAAPVPEPSSLLLLVGAAPVLIVLLATYKRKTGSKS